MSALTITLLIYVILDIIFDIFVAIKLKSKGISLRSLARFLFYKQRTHITNKVGYDEDDFENYEDLTLP